jgi:hypothetical protein
MIYPPSLVRLIEALRCLPASAEVCAAHGIPSAEKDRNGAGFSPRRCSRRSMASAVAIALPNVR